MKAFDYAIARTTEAATTALADGWKPKAGGIDLLDRLKERTETAEKLVSLQPLGELRGIEAKDGGLSIGALTTMRELGASPLVQKAFPALAHAANEAATPQIRAVATVAGNLCQRPRCWYFRNKEWECLKKGGATCFAVDGENQFHSLFDEGPCHIVHPSNIAPALVAAGALLDVASAKGTRSIPLAEFFVPTNQKLDGENVLAADELILRIRVPKLPEKSAYVEARQKQSFDWALASCAAVYLNGRWSVVLGAVASTPRRATKAEELLGSSSIDDALAEKAADAALDGAKPMSKNAWRLKLARAVTRRALLQADGKEAI